MYEDYYKTITIHVENYDEIMETIVGVFEEQGDAVEGIKITPVYVGEMDENGDWLDSIRTEYMIDAQIMIDNP